MSSPALPAYGGAASTAEAPAPVAQPANVPWAPGQSRPITAEAIEKWRGRFERAETKAKRYHPQWERGLKNYAEALVSQAKTEVDALLDYRHVESKKSQLFHRTPEVLLLPADPEDKTLPLGVLLPQRQKLLNHELGSKAANAKRALHKTLIDALAASGWLSVELGFEQVSLPVTQTVPGMLGQPAMSQTVQVPIWSRRFISDISSMKLLVPDDFYDSSNFDAAPWLAYKGVIAVAKARKAGWKIPADFTGTAKADEAVYKHGQDVAQSSEDLCEYIKCWYRAADEDPAVFNPELYRCLILVKGLETEAWHVDCPFQGLTPEGALTDDSLVGNPIHVGTLRDLPDSAYVPSDLVVGEQLSTELNQYRTGLISNRRGRKPLIAMSDKFGQTTIDKATKNDGVVVIPDEFFDGAGGVRGIAVIGTGSEPRDNYTAQDIIERDYEEALGQGANQRGQTAKRKTTATEARIVQGNSSARAETEKDRIKEYFIGLVRKFDVIVQRTATIQEVTKILGKQGGQLWQQWKILPGKYAYDILPDSGQFVDAREHIDHVLNTYNLLRKDERVSVEELLGMVARALKKDPSTFIAPAQDKTTEPPKVSVSINLLDLNDPVAGRVFLDLAANGGIKLHPTTIELLRAAHIANAAAGAAGNTSDEPVGADASGNGHGGSATRTEKINQHSSERTGGVQGVGKVA